MAVTYTKEQERAITLHNRNILVSAAAGSGKTAVLVERIVQMISDEAHPVDIDRILVVTFTNAAAAQMRERIAAAIGKRLEENPESVHLQRQNTLIHNALITTIDSFCLFLIRNHFNEVGLDPGFRIADEGEIKLLFKDTMEQVLEGYYLEKDEDFLQCVEYLSSGSADKVLEEYIEKLYTFAESYPWPEDWIQERKKDYDISEIWDKQEWAEYLFRYIKEVIYDCTQRISQCITMCEQADGPYMYAETLEKEFEMLSGISKCIEWEDYYLAFDKLQFGRLPSKKDASVSIQKREAIQEVRKEIKKILGDVKDKYFNLSAEKNMERMALANQPLHTLLQVTLTFMEAFGKAKEKKNIIDFGDMEHFALNILIHKNENGWEYSKTAKEYQSFFHEILIDEYQDSNFVQELLLSSISGEVNYNRFMVGDVKQSIYKFRLARPEIFMEKYEQYGTCDNAQANSERIDLSKNFRSRDEVISSVNAVFEQIMGRLVGGVEYDDKHALYPGASYPRQSIENDGIANNENETELLLILPEEDSTLTARQQEALVITQRIKELVGRFPVTDKESGELRMCRYDDIVVLLRTNSGWDEEFRKIFEDEGIPLHITSRTGYFKTTEVQTILHLLRVLDNPLQDIPFYGVMKSYFGKFTEEEIAQIIIYTKGRKLTLYERLKILVEDGENGISSEDTIATEDTIVFKDAITSKEAIELSELVNKGKDFITFINNLRDKIVYTPIHDLLEECIIDSGYLYDISALSGGERRRANMLMLLTKAYTFEQTSYHGLFHFIRYIEQLEKYDVDYGEVNTLEEHAEVVRLMSIHKSKGLEFPVCIVAGLGKRFNMQDASGKLIVDADFGIGMDGIDIERRVQSKTLRKNVIAEKMKLDNLGEELRILYVAMTRAKEKLIMTGMWTKPEKSLGKLTLLQQSNIKKLPFLELTGAVNYMELIIPSLVRNKSFDHVWEEYGFAVNPQNLFYENDIHIKIAISTIEKLTKQSMERELRGAAAKHRLLLSEGDSDLMDVIVKSLSATYPHTALSGLYAKTTVSELKRAGMASFDKEDTGDVFTHSLYEEEEVVPYIPAFIRAEEKLSPTDRGNAYHKVMELISFAVFYEILNDNKIKPVEKRKRLAEEIEVQIKAMEEGERLSEEYSRAVDKEKIVEFFLSPIAKRLAYADLNHQVWKEQPFMIGVNVKTMQEEVPEDEMMLIQGMIDCFFEEDGELIVIDYKTDRVKHEKELIKRYESQLVYYGEALKQITGKKVREKVIYSFVLGKEIVVEGV